MREHYHRLLCELCAIDAAHLRGMVPGQKVIVSGVRASTQTPPIPSGKRIIFCALKDGRGLVDIAVFEDPHEHVAHTVLHSGLLLVRGQVEARAVPSSARWPGTSNGEPGLRWPRRRRSVER